MVDTRAQRILTLLFLIILASGTVSAKPPSEKIHPAFAHAHGHQSVDVIVEYAGQDELDDSRLTQHQCGIHKNLHAVHGISAACPGSELDNIAAEADVTYIWEDEILYPLLDQSVPLINGTLAWQAFGNGTGINVSVIDTGINISHPWLADAVILQKDLTPEGILDDRCNHGTAAACIVGCRNDTYSGVAPGVTIFNAKAGRVLNENPLQCGASATDMIAAIDWSVENHAQVIIMGFGSFVSPCYASVTAQAVNRTGANITIVVGSGNSGPGNGSINTPACAENAIAVGASNGNTIESFSSRGPTDYGVMKPDVVAPGTAITAAHNSGIGTSDYTGTSFSGPHVAGVVALMQRQKRLRPSEVKLILTSTAFDMGYEQHEQGAGRVDAYAAVAAAVALPDTVILNATALFKNTTAQSDAQLIAVLRNEGNQQANATSLTLLVPSGVTLLSAATVATDGIPGLEDRAAAWLLRANVSANYTLTVIANASNAAATNQTAIVELFAPKLVASPAVPNGSKVGQLFVINATIVNTGADAFNVSAKLATPANLTILGTALKNISTLAQGASIVVNWTVNASLPRNYTANITLNASGIAPNVTFFVVRAIVEAHINFQTAGAIVPFGYVNDSGKLYGTVGNFSFGWNALNDNARDRNSSSSPDQRYDTLNHMQKPSNSNASWSLAVPNGTYSVHVVAGDPDNFDSVYRILAEGKLAINATPNSTVRWFEKTLLVNVSDGRLTIANAAGSNNNKINFVDVVSV